MKFLDEFRSTDDCQQLIRRIRETVTAPRTIMEVCGGQTHGLLAHGIDNALQGSIRLLHGPGCPVCVTPASVIDQAIKLAQHHNVTITSFGDMLRVPGTHQSLLESRSENCDVRLVYSPLDALNIAQQEPNRQVVFLAVGFETTIPATALAVQQAQKQRLSNFSLLVSHVRVQPAMEMIMSQPDCSIEGFLAAGHVCTVAGYESYHAFAESYQTPVVITGFEPVDLLSGILECVNLIEQKTPVVVNKYARSVRAGGNPAALKFVHDVFTMADQEWRGIGVIPDGGYKLREPYYEFDATQRFRLRTDELEQQILFTSGCRAGDVLIGRISPSDCEHFANACTPLTPLGAPMISSEGACAAYYEHARSAANSQKDSHD